jgi:outer membrane protein TolC
VDVPDVTLSAEAYVGAGLAIPAAEEAVAATAAETEAERAALAGERAKNGWALRRLLGAPPCAEVTLALPPADWPAVPPATTAALLRSRADLQRGLASYETADREFRKAVLAQQPSLVLSPAWSFDDAWLFGKVGVRLPFGAAGEARAAEAAREAARHELAAQVLDALSEARVAREEALVAARRLEGARRRSRAALDLFTAAKGRVELTSESFLEAAMAAESALGAAREWRMAAVEDARARVRAARAQGWPAAEGCR